MITEGTKPRPMVLFVCQHGAAKSVLAAAELDRLATAAGVSIEIQAAGVEPDAAVAPAVAAILPEETRLRLSPPRKVMADDVARALRTITFDLEPSDLPPSDASVQHWDGLPPASDDPRRTLEAMQPRLRALLDEVAARR